MNIMHFARIGAMGILGVLAVIIGIWQYFRGMVGSEDVSFLLLRFPRSPDEQVRACSLRTYKFRPIIENTFLGLCATGWMMKGKGILRIPKAKWQQAIMNPFIDLFSEIANARHGVRWADCDAHREVPFVFWVTSVKSTRGRLKMRAIALRKQDLELLAGDGLEKMTFHPDLLFLKELFPQMLECPQAAGEFSEFVPVRRKRRRSRGAEAPAHNAA